jgi:hypothetical protein
MSKNVYMGQKKSDRPTIIAAEDSLSVLNKAGTVMLGQIAEQLLWET